MSSSLYDHLLLIGTLSLLSLYFVIKTFKERLFPNPHLPPGSLGWPLIGESLEFLRSGHSPQPERFTRDRMEKYNPQVFKTSLLGESMAVFCGPAGNKFLFSNENKLVNLWWPRSVKKLLESSLVNVVGDEAKKMKRMIMTSLDQDALKRYVGRMDLATQHHIRKHWEGVIHFPINIPGTRFYSASKAANEIKKELRLIARQRRDALDKKIASPGQDLLSHLLLSTDAGGRFLSESEIVDNLLLLLFASHDTTTSVITCVIKYLAELPEVFEMVLREQLDIAKSKEAGELLKWEDIQKMRYSWNVVYEVLRLMPPIRGAFREAIVDFTYAGYTIPKGWKLCWTPASTTKDPGFFPNAEDFVASRYEGAGPAPYSFVPFGGGPRICMGNEYARPQILVFLHNVVKRFKWDLLIPDEKIPYDPMPAPSQGLPVRLQPRQSSA
ncbi:CYTOCHROME P450 26 [Salix viminalis]|uniref:CYTOCHROME P450 26 n=1 Tax=Salix viminalis TaxID=40686 RepID=A0A9Q0TMA8_SALVM|nr:CYTOCHROME P450 26 [Salix viminalis]